MPQYVVDDTPELLVTYLPEGAPIGFLPDSDHPWYPQTEWQGSGALELRRPGDVYSVIHFWRGENGAFSCWYINLEEPFRRTPIGFDYADLELDIVVLPDGSWSFKDWDLLDEHVASGRYRAEQVSEIRADGLRIGAELDAGRAMVERRLDHVDARPGVECARADRRLERRTSLSTGFSWRSIPPQGIGCHKYGRWRGYSTARRRIAPTASASTRKPSWPRTVSTTSTPDAVGMRSASSNWRCNG